MLYESSASNLDLCPAALLTLLKLTSFVSILRYSLVYATVVTPLFHQIPLVSLLFFFFSPSVTVELY